MDKRKLLFSLLINKLLDRNGMSDFHDFGVIRDIKNLLGSCVN